MGSQLNDLNQRRGQSHSDTHTCINIYIIVCMHTYIHPSIMYFFNFNLTDLFKYVSKYTKIQCEHGCQKDRYVIRFVQ